MKFHGVEMRGNFICLTVSNTGELGPAGVKGRLVHVESSNAIYVDTGTEWKRTGIDPYLVDANTLIGGISDNVPTAVSASENQIFGRLTGGNIKGLSTAEITTLIDHATSADVIDGTSNVVLITPLALANSRATSADIVDGTNDTKMITPNYLAQTRATSADIIAGTSNVLLVTPLALSNSVATSADIVTGTNKTKIITPYWLANSVATSADIVTGTNRTEPITPYWLANSVATSADIVTGTERTKSITPYWLANSVATSADVATGTNRTKMVTPLYLAQTRATSADVIAGTSNVVLVTPLSLVNSRATSADVVTGTSTTKFITPSVLTSSRSTSADVITGTSTTQVVTPSSISNIVKPFVRGGTIANDIDYLRPINSPVWYCNLPCKVTAVRGMRVDGTAATINARRNRSGSYANHLGSNLSLATSGAWYSSTTIQNSDYVVGDFLEIMLVTISASASQVAIQVDFEKV